MLCCGGGGGDTAVDTGEEQKFKVLEGRWNIERKAMGEGGFGTVHLCSNIRTGQQRACKAMRLPSALDREDFRHEVMILKQVTAPNIAMWWTLVKMHVMVVRHAVMHSGELFDKIARQCNERDSAMAVVDVLSALNFIHSKRILHRDSSRRTCFTKTRR